MRLLVSSIIVLNLIIGAPEAKIVARGSVPKLIALTFDDGPSDPYTLKVIEELKKEKIKATFFLVGKKVVAKPNVLDVLVASGQEIGNHTYYHSRLNWVTERKMLDELKLSSDIISGYTNGRVKPTLFRPPHGFLPQSKSQAIQKAGYTIVMWSVNGDDFYHSKTGIRSPVSIAERVLSRINGGDIILLHDISQQTVDSLSYIIRPLKRKGYKFVTVSELVRLSGRYALALKKRPPVTEEVNSVLVLPMQKIKPESSYFESQPNYGLPLPGPEDRSAIQTWPRRLFDR